MLAQNSLLEMLKHLSGKFYINKHLMYKDYFSNKTVLLESVEMIKKQEKGNPHSQISLFMDTFLELDDILKELKSLQDCSLQKDWSYEVNQELCDKGLRFEFYAMIFLLMAISAMFPLSVAIFLTENVIKGIYQEESRYVKTNKQRYDWN